MQNGSSGVRWIGNLVVLVLWCVMAVGLWRHAAKERRFAATIPGESAKHVEFPMADER